MRVGRGGKEPSVCKQQCSFVPKNTGVNYQLKYPCADRAKKKRFCKLYKKREGDYEYSNKKVNATSWQS